MVILANGCGSGGGGFLIWWGEVWVVVVCGGGRYHRGFVSFLFFVFCFLINCRSFFNIILMYCIYYFNVLNGKKIEHVMYGVL